MPSYDYECTQCRHRFEERHAMGAPAPHCPQCAGAVRKVFLSAPAAHGHMARGREQAIRSLTPQTPAAHTHGPGCGCGHSH